MSWLLLAPVWIMLWAMLAAPAIALAWWSVRRLRQRGDRRAFWPPLLAAGFSLLAAPLPTPILTVFVPHALLLMQGRYYPELDGHPEQLAQLWPWVRGSLVLSFALGWIGFRQLLQKPHRA